MILFIITNKNKSSGTIASIRMQRPTTVSRVLNSESFVAYISERALPKAQRQVSETTISCL